MNLIEFAVSAQPVLILNFLKILELFIIKKRKATTTHIQVY